MGRQLRSERNAEWIERHCVIPEGKYVGQHVRLTDEQRGWLQDIYDSPTRMFILSVGRKNAKALALDTPIPTPHGWRNMGDIRPGDQVLGSDGKPVTVAAESDVFLDKRCYRVTFSDGSSIVASEDHLWETRHKYRPWNPPATYSSGKVRGNGSCVGREETAVISTSQVARSVNVPRPDGKVEHNHSIGCSPPAQMSSQSVPVDPYVLGAWLGDGTSLCAAFTCSEDDLPALQGQLESRLGGKMTVYRGKDRAPTIRASRTGLQSRLRSMGLLGDKHIPQSYLDASEEQRWELLRGLMDTDGTVNRCGGKTTARCSFTGNSECLTYGVWRLARSLGLKATRIQGVAKCNGRDCGPYWEVAFPACQETRIFHLDRKQELLPAALGKRSGTLKITGCEDVGVLPTKCIAVDSPDRLFLAGHGCIKTHNTVFGAFLLLLHTVGPEARQNSQLYSDAQSREQAAILFHYAAKIVRMSPTLRDFVVIRDTAKELLCSELGTKYKALSAEASTAYGLSPAFALHDELGQVRGPRSELYDAVESAMGAQESPLSVVISTQAPTEGDLLSMLIDDALTGTDPKVKVRLYTASEDDDPFDIDTIRQANPHLDAFMNVDEVLAQAEKAKRLPSMEASFRNLILNQRVEANDPFVTKSVWDANGAAPEIDGPVYGGLDLSMVNDLTALVLTTTDGDAVPTFWLPEDGIAEKSRKDRVPYDVWAREGFLQLCPGRAVDYEWVAHRLREVFDEYDIKAIAFDRWGIEHLRPWLIRAGFTEDELERFEPFGQGFKDMSPALRATESLLLNEKIKHGMHPVLRMCAANAVVQSDPAGNRKLAKDKSTGRIDGMVALAMAVGVMTKFEEEETPVSPWEDDNFRMTVA